VKWKSEAKCKAGWGLPGLRKELHACNDSGMEREPRAVINVWGGRVSHFMGSCGGSGAYSIGWKR